jgi:hypothetical protein
VVVVLVALLVAGCGGGDPTEDVRESFDALRAALDDQDGEAALALVTPGSLVMYERARKLALDTGDTDLESLPQLDVLLVFQLRWLLPAERLEQMDGADLFKWGVEEGMVKKESIAAIEINEVERDGDTAIATLKSNGQPVGDMVFHFELHDGVWQLDFNKIVQATEEPLKALREQTGKTKTELAIFFVEQTYQTKMPPEILTGPVK